MHNAQPIQYDITMIYTTTGVDLFRGEVMGHCAMPSPDASLSFTLVGFGSQGDNSVEILETISHWFINTMYLKEDCLAFVQAKIADADHRHSTVPVPAQQSPTETRWPPFSMAASQAFRVVNTAVEAHQENLGNCSDWLIEFR